MNKEIKYLLEEIKDNTQDYVGTNGCLYQDLLREELNLLLDYINNLEQQVKKQKEVIDKLNIRIEENKKNIDESGSFVETYTGWKLIPEILEELLDILKEVSE